MFLFVCQGHVFSTESMHVGTHLTFCAKVLFCISLISAPAANARSLPVRIRHPMVGFSSKAEIASPTSFIN